MALGRRIARSVGHYLSPQWKVVACSEETIFGVVIHSHYLQSTAERRAASLNAKLPGIKIGVYFKAQKVTCR